MKVLKIILGLTIFGLLFSGCGSSDVKKWVPSEMAGIANPGFTISAKTVSNTEVRYSVANLSDQKVSDFFQILYASAFAANQNYIADTNYVSYAAFNAAGESLHFVYHPSDKTGVLIYGKGTSNRFIPGLRDMGYWIQSNYEYASNSDSTKYNATLWYTIGLNVKMTDYLNTITSCKISGFAFKSTSRVGNLSFGNDAWASSPANFTKTCTNLGTLNFVVRQRDIGFYPTNMAYTQDKSPYFTKMGISQADLNFTITFMVDIVTSKGSFTKAYELKILPSGFDTTKMNVQGYSMDQSIPISLLDFRLQNNNSSSNRFISGFI